MFLEKSVTKKINLLYFIDLLGPTIDVNNILHFLSISKNTLKKYIKEINEGTSDYHINYKDNRLYIKDNQKKTGSIVAREILDESINLKIFYEIFRYELTLSELAEKLFLSNSTILNKITSINSYFREKELLISIENKGSYQVLGDEVSIRKFLSIIFFEINNFDLLNPYRDILSEAHRLIEKYFPSRHTFYKSNAVDVALYVSIVRTAQGHLIYQSLSEIPDEISAEVKLIHEYFFTKKPLINTIERLHKTTYDLLFTANTVNRDLVEATNISKTSILINGEQYSKLESILLRYCKLYGVIMSNREKNEFLLYLCKRVFLTDPYNQVFLKDFEIHFNYLREISPGKIEFLLQSLTETNLLLSVDPSVVYEFIIFFILTDKNIRFNFFNNAMPVYKKVLIYSSKQASIAEMIGYIIQDKFEDNVQLEVDYLLTLYENKAIEEYDVIISDIYMEEFKDKYLYLSMIPNDKFWEEFEKRIYTQN
jgi:hypothetical protein